VAHIFRLSIDELLREPNEYKYMDVGRQAWNQPLWEELCGCTPAPADGAERLALRLRASQRDVRKSKVLARARSAADALAAREMAVRNAAKFVPSLERCGDSLELFTFAVLCWSRWTRSRLDALVSASRLREYIFRTQLNGAEAMAALDSLRDMPTSLPLLLAEVAAHEDLLTFPSVRLPSDRQLYDEQKEIATLFRDWWFRREPKLLLYQAPPSGGKTSTVALLGALYHTLYALASEKLPRVLVTYACHAACVRDHLCDHLRGCRVPHAIVTEGASARMVSASGTVAQDVCTLEQLLEAHEAAPATGPAKELPVVFVTDLKCARMVCRRRPQDVLVLDEASLRAGCAEEREQLLGDAPSCTVLMSSCLPDKVWLAACTERLAEARPGLVAQAVMSRRLRQSYTALLPDGSVAMPHHFGVPASVLRRQQHLSRFYSAAALAAIIAEEQLEPDEVLELDDLLSHKSIRRKCLDLVEEGLAKRRRATDGPEDGNWRAGGAWEAGLGRDARELPKGVCIIFARDAEECLEQGASVWKRCAQCWSVECPSQTPARLRAAAQKGVAVLDDRPGEDASEYRRWAYAWAQNGGCRCLVVVEAMVHGLHLPVTRVVLRDLPSNYEVAAHLCGRTARINACQEAQVMFGSEAAAAAVLVPPEGHSAGDARPEVPH